MRVAREPRLRRPRQRDRRGDVAQPHADRRTTTASTRTSFPARPPRTQTVALTAYNNATRSHQRLQSDRRDLYRAHRSRPPHAAGGRRSRPAADRQLPQHRLFQQHRYVDQRAVRDPTISTPVTFRQSATDADNHVRHHRRRRVRAGSGRALAPRAAARRPAVRPVRLRLPQQPQRR